MLLFTAMKDNRTVTAKGGILKQASDFCGILRADFFRLATVPVSFYKSHTVLGKGTSFIRADDRGAAKCFHCGEPADNGVLFDHSLHADGEDNSNDSRKALRNGRYGQRNRCHENFHNRDAIYNANDKNNGAGGNRKNSQIFAQLCQLFLERSLPFFLIFQKIGNFAHFSVHTSGGNHCGGGTISNAATGKDHIIAISQRGILIDNRPCVLFRRNRFASQRGFFAF